MTYKNIAFIALLLPIFSYGESKANRIKHLKKLQLEKLLELREIGESISKGDKYIDYCHSMYSNKFYHIAKIKSNAILEKSKQEGKSTKEIKKLEETLLEECQKSMQIVNESLANNLSNAFIGKKKFNYNLQQELIDDSISDKDEIFNSIKFMHIRVRMELEYIKLLIIKYENCLTEVLQINQELFSLQK